MTAVEEHREVMTEEDRNLIFERLAEVFEELAAVVGVFTELAERLCAVEDCIGPEYVAKFYGKRREAAKVKVTATDVENGPWGVEER